MKQSSLAFAPQPGPDMRVYQIAPQEIGYLSGLIEAYEGIGLVRTLDRHRGIVELWVMPDAREDFALALGAFAREFSIRPLAREID